MTALAPCSSCGRHVKRDELACPFCGAEHTEGAPSAGVPPRGRLPRVAAIALAAGIGTAACGDAEPVPKPADGGSMGSDGGGPAPLYGAPAPDGGAPADGGSMGSDGGGPAPLYGAPAPDGGDLDGGGPAPAYGAPAPDGGS